MINNTINPFNKAFEIKQARLLLQIRENDGYLP